MGVRAGRGEEEVQGEGGGGSCVLLMAIYGRCMNMNLAVRSRH